MVASLVVGYRNEEKFKIKKTLHVVQTSGEGRKSEPFDASSGDRLGWQRHYPVAKEQQ